MATALIEGTGSTTGGKLPEAVRTAFLAGEYEEGALRLEVTLINAAETVERDLMAVVCALGSTELGLYGLHPREPGELNNPDFAITVHNPDGDYTPAYSAGLFPDGDWAGWRLEVGVREYVTDPAGGDLIFLQALSVVEISTSRDEDADLATILAAHPVQGWLSRKWTAEDSDPVDWNGASH